ncbi:MAG: DUF2782 domain-containing protein [Chromatiaceae bacterium]|nr:MAG: DUF2782 domain-containing protein [Chromatiaceae bacterium]
MPIRISPAPVLTATPRALPAPALVAVLSIPILLSPLLPAPRALAQSEGGTFLSAPEVPSAPFAGDRIGVPDIIIRETETETITEYSVRGQVYMVRVQPSVGPPYYLLDTNGDGQLDVQSREPPAAIAVPQWLLFSW